MSRARLTNSRAAALTRLLALAAIASTAACDSPAPEPLPLVDVGALRAKVSACTGVDTAAAFSFFWPESVGGVADAHDCVAAAVDCAAVLACAGYQDVGCSAATDRCEGGAAFACQGLASGIYAARTTLCTDSDDTCSIADDAKYGLGAFCHGAACTDEHCDGDNVVRCRGGFEVHTDCRAQGQGCAEYQGQAYCAYDDACTTDHCAGDSIEICNGGRVTLRAGCAELVPGTTCNDDHGIVECVAPNPSADCAFHADFEGWCESGLAVTCLGGVRVEVDCGALPGGACEPGADATGTTATCATTASL